MNKEVFYQNLQKVEVLLQTRDNYFHKFNDEVFFKEILKNIKLDTADENIYALKKRIRFLSDDLLVQKIKNSDNDFISSKLYVFKKVADIYQKKHQELINEINDKKLLSDFYIEILQGVHNIGLCMTDLSIIWQEHIYKINNQLKKDFSSDNEIYKFLQENSLLDTFDGQVSDRCYSVLIKENDKYIALTYKNAFKKEVQNIIKEIDIFIEKLLTLNDDIFHQEKYFIKYFKAIKNALNQDEISKTIQAYNAIDIAWMDLTSPIQVSHMMEYYEDTYRKSVAIEWDIRLDSKHGTSRDIKKDIINLKDIMSKNNNVQHSISSNMDYALDNTQLYISRALIFYGTSFNGMFSAQVVPNDESVSKKYGKKIFAFRNSVLEQTQQRDFMKMDSEIFDKDFLYKYRRVIFKDTNIYNKIYDISTIGHEYGHMLWCDENSESVMNNQGNFKNVEEFKATTGGVMAFFYSNDLKLYEHLLVDIIKRAVGLLVYFDNEEIRPYYCEGLIHLDILFRCGALSYKDGLSIDLNVDIKEEYKKAYEDLIYNFYLQKAEPTGFLDKYMTQEDNIFMPKDKDVKDFAIYVQNLYKTIGSQVDKSIKKEEYR